MLAGRENNKQNVPLLTNRLFLKLEIQLKVAISVLLQYNHEHWSSKFEHPTLSKEVKAFKNISIYLLTSAQFPQYREFYQLIHYVSSECFLNAIQEITTNFLSGSEPNLPLQLLFQKKYIAQNDIGNAAQRQPFLFLLAKN